MGSATISLLLDALSGSDQPSALARHVSDQTLAQMVLEKTILTENRWPLPTVNLDVIISWFAET